MIAKELEVELRRFREEQQSLELFPILDAGYRTIQLTQGKNTLVNLEDFIKFGHLNWHAHRTTRNFYATKQSKRDSAGRQRLIGLHRLINSTPHGLETHHKDHDGLNNTRDNLEPRTRLENGQDQVKIRGTTSRYKGVSYHKSRQRPSKWCASIMVGSVAINLGYYPTEVDAALAYDNASEHYHGRFGSTNEQLFGRYWLEDPGVQP